MSTQISEAAVSRREANRERTGRFGNDPAAEADLLLDDLDPVVDQEGEGEPEAFDFDRISSLMGEAYHLDPERKVALPRITEDDTIAQVHHKLNRYLAKTQDLSDMDDAELAEKAGHWHDPDAEDEMPENLRNEFGISESDRVVVAEDSNGYPVYISVGNTAKKTGTYLYRHGGQRDRLTVMNAAEVTIQPTMQQEFAEDHPELTGKEVKQAVPTAQR